MHTNQSIWHIALLLCVTVN